MAGPAPDSTGILADPPLEFNRVPALLPAVYDFVPLPYASRDPPLVAPAVVEGSPVVAEARVVRLGRRRRALGQRALVDRVGGLDVDVEHGREGRASALADHEHGIAQLELAVQPARLASRAVSLLCAENAR